MSQAKHNHLISNVPNTEKNREFVKDINKKTKESNSIWRLSIRYRKPKEGHKYGYGGNLKCENANAFSVYVHDRRSYSQIPENQYRSKLWEENRKLEEENESLKKQLAIYKNPYIDWSISSINDEIFEVKESIVERYLESDDGLKDDTLKEKYNELMEALEYAEKSD
jgi:hypothetical protein|tara:strand:- start:324 stop:824 length:501 start_codon:yes stop_codon:yes gene_type:complete